MTDYPSLVKYAGQEAPEPPSLTRPARALMMFRAGKDTADLAEYFKIREPTALRWITEQRSRERGLPNPYRSVKE